jgi:hypothetical protein
MMQIKCCKGCVPPKRHTACWDHCPEYNKENAENKARKAILDKEKSISLGIYSQKSKAVSKALKNRRYSQKNYRRGSKSSQ